MGFVMKDKFKLIKGVDSEELRFEACLETVMRMVNSEEAFYMDRILLELISGTAGYNIEEFPSLGQLNSKLTESYYWWKEYLDET